MASGRIQKIPSFTAIEAVTANTSLNTLTTPGVYRIWGTYQDAPITSGLFGFMLVMGDGGARQVQVLFAATSAYVYYRGYANDQWNSWRTLFAA